MPYMNLWTLALYQVDNDPEDHRRELNRTVEYNPESLHKWLSDAVYIKAINSLR